MQEKHGIDKYKIRSVYLVGVIEEISKNIHGSELRTIPSMLVHQEIKATDCGV